MSHREMNLLSSGSETLIKDVIVRHVEKICDSPEFRSKQVLCRFLSYIVSETLAGKGDDIKAFSIGVDVFNRDADFDPGQDTLVRINAGRLRRMLDLYYSNSGKDDNLRIEIPKGGYIPQIIAGSGSVTEPGTGSSAGTEKGRTLEPSIAVLSLKNLDEDPNNAYFARGFSYELLVELTKFEDLQVYNYLSITDHPLPGSQFHNTMLETGIRFALGGAVHGDQDRINVLVELRDLYEGRQIWSERYSKRVRAESVIEIQELIAHEISGKLGSEYGIILHRLSQDAEKEKPKKWSTYCAVLKFYNYLVQNTPESVAEAFEALKSAVENDPQSGIALSCLAALHGNAYAMDYPGAEKSYIIAGELSERAYLLDRYNIFVQVVLGFKCFLYDEKERFFHLADRILEQNPKSTLRLGSLGFYLALYGDWDRGKLIMDSVMNGHMEYPKYLHGATTLYHFRKQSYEEALKESKLYRVPGFFWGPLLRAMVMGQLGLNDEARSELEQLKLLRPDFEEKAAYLISRFVKEESLVDLMLKGLQKAGLRIS